MIEVKNLKKSYSNIQAVDDLSFKAEDGEVLGFLGPNGAGKSTTMKIIAGFMLPDSGSVSLDTIDAISNPIEAKKIIGYMPENNPLFKEMLVSEALNFASKIHDIPNEKRASQIDYAVEATGLQKAYHRPIGELSKGYKQRVGLALVLVHNPKILVLDEPTEGLDPNQRAEIRELIKKLGKERTVMISTHVMQEVEAMCSRIIIINKGKLVKEGTKDDVMNTGIDRAKLRFKKLKDAKINELFPLKDFTLQNQPSILSEDMDSIEIEFAFTNKAKFIEALNKKIQDRKLYLYEFVMEKQNLEELFKELTN